MKTITKLNKIIHGGDYNPEQWLNRPDVLAEDIRLMKLAKCNAMSLGIFSWSVYEPFEGEYHFEWLDEIIENLYKNGIYTILATPSGSKPKWMTDKYPEILRTNENLQKQRYEGRHNHCLTSPIYRKKVREMNEILANRYKDNPAIILWHVSNEYSGECYCELCQEKFREFLEEKYQNIDNLNEQYWTTFWSHKYTSFDQIEAPSKLGERQVHGLNLDWKRFISKQTINFYQNEIEPLRRLTPNIPVTTNFMDFFYGTDYFDFAKYVDVVSLDLYPRFRNNASDIDESLRASFNYDLMRSLKYGENFMLMETTPSSVNWQDVSTLKRPNQHIFSTLLPISCGSETVQYFQWRQSRGSSEKFHGAVVDHSGSEETRVFKEISKLGNILNNLDEILGSKKTATVALYFDWSNWWAFDDAQGYSTQKDYHETCFSYYKALMELGFNVDLINSDSDFSKYKSIVAPMMYIATDIIAKKLEYFLENGGKLIGTYISGIVNENDLVHLGGFPGPLSNIYGIWVTETDVLYDDIKNSFIYNGNKYECNRYFDIIKTKTAKAISEYQSDFYKSTPVITENHHKKGTAYYIGSRVENNFIKTFLADILDMSESLKQKYFEYIDDGIIVSSRKCENSYEYLFVLNSTNSEKTIRQNKERYDIISNINIMDYTLNPYEVLILKTN